MTEIRGEQMRCSEPSTECFFRIDNRCDFWNQAEQIPGIFEPIFGNEPDGPSFIDTFREPCLDDEHERSERCESFYVPGEEGYLQCENCREYICGYQGRDDSVGDVLAHLRKEGFSTITTKDISLLHEEDIDD